LDQQEDEMNKGEFWMVWNPQGDRPTVQHQTEDAARDEACRLARQHSTAVFIVLQARFFVRQKPPALPPVEVVRISEFSQDDIPF
jgi:hypothetical protein